MLTPLSFSSQARSRFPARRMPPTAPSLGMHTDEVLADVLRLSAAEIGRLHDAGLVAGL